MKTDCIRHTHINKKEVQTIAVCGGSSFFTSKMRNDNKQMYLLQQMLNIHDFF